MKNKTIKRAAFLLASMVLAFYPVAAQENITQISFADGKNSMIKLISGNDWMVYSQNGTHGEFTKITASGTASIMELNPLLGSVSDFLIFEGSVFFCGMSAYGNPYFAFFSHSAFPSTAVIYNTLEDAKSVRNLTVYKSPAGVRHVVLTGQDHEGYGILIEAVDMSPGWQVFYSKVFAVEGEKYTFDDIAISESHVAFTAVEQCDENRDSLYHIHNSCPGRVWFIDKPQNENNLITFAKNYVNVPYLTSLPFIIKHAEEDAFVTATQGFFNTYVSGFIGTSHYATVYAKTNKLMDISYSPDSKSTELLTYHMSSTLEPYDASYVHTILPGMSYAAGTAYGHVFHGYHIPSLDYQLNNCNHYICSGYNTGAYPTYLQIPRYHFSLTQGCSEKTSLGITPYEWEKEPLKGDCKTESEYLGDPIKILYVRDAKIEKVCEGRSADNE